MIVRCGRCQVELEVAGAGEFACPSCGTRNVVRGPPALDLPDLGEPGPPIPAPPEQPSSIRWVTCPSCSFRFAFGEISDVTCPSCSEKVPITDREVATSSE